MTPKARPTSRSTGSRRWSAKREFKVVDAKTGEDITRQVLTQIIIDEEHAAARPCCRSISCAS